jgi:type IV secretory pathway VirB2 component (pilin)
MAAKARRQPIDPAIFSAVRMLIASYFLASAGLIENEAGANFLSAVLPGPTAEAMATTIFYATGFAIMIGCFVREAALILAIFVFWSSYTDNMLTGEIAPLMETWQDMAIVGSVMLMGLTLPGGSRSLRLSFARAKPRRVAVARPDIRRERPAQLEMAELNRKTPEIEADEDNIFADLRPA